MENLAALEKGFPNLDRHLENIKDNYGLPVVVSINHFYHDTDAEIAMLKKCLQPPHPCALFRCRHDTVRRTAAV